MQLLPLGSVDLVHRAQFAQPDRSEHRGVPPLQLNEAVILTLQVQDDEVFAGTYSLL